MRLPTIFLACALSLSAADRMNILFIYTDDQAPWALGLSGAPHASTPNYDYFMGFRGGGTTPVDPVLEKEGRQQQFQGLTTDILTDHALEFLEKEKDGPFLLSLHYRAPHTRWLLLDGTAKNWENDLYGEYSTKRETRTHMRMYRTPRWKLVRDLLNPERDELYDLRADPHETTNAIRLPAKRKIVARLSAELAAKMKETGDRLMKR